MGPEDLQVVKYTEATTLSDWAFAHKAPARVPFLFNYSSGEGTHSGAAPPLFLMLVGYSSSSSTAGKSSGVASRSGVHSVAPYSFRSATDESVQAIGLAL